MRRSPHFVRAAVALSALAAATISAPSFHADAVQPRLVVAHATSLPSSATAVTTPVTDTFDVVLAGQNSAAEAAYLRAISTPGSPLYRHFLTPTGFAQRFGAARNTIAQVTQYFSANGLHPLSLSTGGLVLHVRATTTAISHVFNAHVSSARTSQGVVSSFTQPATLPASIAHDIVAVAGLNGASGLANHLVHAHSTSGYATTCSHVGAANGSRPNANGYTVQQQGTLYGLSPLWHAGINGHGTTIALYELGVADTSDINVFNSCYGLSPTITTIPVDGGATGGYSDEATMDIEEAAALAPGATLDVYSAPNAGSDPLDVYTRIADDNAVDVVATSWGDCENDPTGSVVAEAPLFQQMAAEGITVVAASGDNGSSDCTGLISNAPAVDDPASQPFVTGVGGLTVSNLSPLTQTVWNSNGGGSGGGISDQWSRPWWQTGQFFMNDPSQGVASATGRMVPDVSVMADPGTGFIQYFTGTDSSTVVCTTATCHNGWSGVGGTSIGAPLVGAMVALAKQKCGQGRLGFLNPTLYTLAASTTDITPITTGNNDIANVNAYSAGQGYNLAVGLGAPTTTLIGDLCPMVADPAQSSFTIGSTSPLAGTTTPVNITLRSSAGTLMPNVPVTFEVIGPSGAPVIDGLTSSTTGSGTASLTANTSINGTVTFTFSAPSEGIFTVVAYDNGAAIGSGLIDVISLASLQVPPNTPTITLKARGTTSLTLNVTATAGRYPATYYQVSVTNGASWVTRSATSPLLLTGLHRGRPYTVIVRAGNAYGASGWSTSLHLRTAP